ncbi:hypothetical protein [Methylotenera versatilis]|jgi:hypothetical protein|uniref:DUF304 domain-containing protein n=1 Tax=Methylotenera versatilis (strain 301) TaxID=666681 RepID=D7DML9_METV0|nr:hypothetical protein [Methylotenera versatilis]ADI30796.1 conserved hypothetical protein [Methylotenera versatilis 301]
MLEVSESLLRNLNSELRRDEVLKWVAQPISSQLVKSSFWLWLFFIPWTAFSLFWTAGASGFHWPDWGNLGAYSLFPLFGLPFIAIGIWGLALPFTMRRKANSTVYAITNQRLLIASFGKTTNLQIFFPKDVNHLNRVEKSDGSGDLIFSHQIYRDSDGDRNIAKEGFYAVRDLKKVERLIEDFLKTNQQI